MVETDRFHQNLGSRTMTLRFISRCLFCALAALAVIFGADVAHAAQPAEWHLGFQAPVTPVMERLIEFHNMLLWIISGISVFVLGLLIYVSVRFREKANPTPSRTTHNVPLEIIWTVVPVIILIIIVIPSLQLLYYMDKTQKPEMTLKVTGYQWYWGYEYPDHGGINFLANMIPDKDIAGDQKRLLSTDVPVVIPVDTDIEVLVTAADVLHAFAVPAFGVKKDAVPGRLNHTWMRVTKPGVYYGQCSELCGTGHAFMPIEIHAVSKPEFEAWVAAKKKEQNIVDAPAGAAPAAVTPATPTAVQPAVKE
jgi:cytochrome c oxidase subunit 2